MPPGVVRVAREVAHRYGRVRVLDGIELALAPGECVALHGANGAGKTTLLRILAGLLRPQRGSVEGPGAGRAGIAFVGQAPGLYGELTARENVYLFAQLCGLSAPAAAADAALHAFGLADRPALRARTLSRGQQQRLALARAFMTRPHLVLLDEPWTALDAAGGALLDRAIAAACAGGTAVLFAAHDDGRARALADRVAVLEGGRLRWQRGPEASDGRGDGAREGDGDGKGDGKGDGDGDGKGDGKGDGDGDGKGDGARGMSAPAAAPRRLPALLRGAWLIAQKDVRSELRAREMLPAIGVFAMLCGTVLAYAFGGVTAELPRVAPGAFWVALQFGGTLGLGRMIAAEVEGDALSALRLTGLDGGSLFLGKWAAATAFTLAIAGVLAPLWVALFALRAVDVFGLAAVAAVGVPGWAAAGVLVAAVSATARGREVLLPILLLPLLLPLVLAAVRATGLALADAPLTDLGPALALMAAYDVIFCVVGFWLFPVVVDTT